MWTSEKDLQDVLDIFKQVNKSLRQEDVEAEYIALFKASPKSNLLNSVISELTRDGYISKLGKVMNGVNTAKVYEWALTGRGSATTAVKRVVKVSRALTQQHTIDYLRKVAAYCAKLPESAKPKGLEDIHYGANVMLSEYGEEQI